MFELGGGKSATVIFRRTPGASFVQSPIAALRVSSVPLSAAASNRTAMLKATAMTSTEEKTQTAHRFSIHVSNRFGPKDRVDKGEFNALECANMCALWEAATCRRTPKSSPRMCALRLGQALGGRDDRSRLQH
jgi:hypothetical protein